MANRRHDQANEGVWDHHVSSRLGPAWAAVMTLIAGLMFRYGLEGFWAKYPSVALWSVLVYALIVFMAPRIEMKPAAATALGISWFVEFGQLTPAPSWLSSKHIVLSWIFGATFSTWDLVANAAGIAFAACMHWLLKRMGRPPF